MFIDLKTGLINHNKKSTNNGNIINNWHIFWWLRVTDVKFWHVLVLFFVQSKSTKQPIKLITSLFTMNARYMTAFIRSINRKIILTIILITASFMTLANNKSHEFTISAIADNVYQHTSYLNVDGVGWVDSNGLVVVDANKALIIDTPWSVHDTNTLVQWIAAQKFELIGSVSTHWHQDRSAGIGFLNEHKIPTYASLFTNELLAKHSKPMASNILTNPNATLLNGTVEVFYPGPGHSEDNLIVWLPSLQLLFAGCLVRSLNWQHLGFVGDANLIKWPQTIRTLLTTYPNIQTVIPGHGQLGNVDILMHTLALAEQANKQ